MKQTTKSNETEAKNNNTPGKTGSKSKVIIAAVSLCLLLTAVLTAYFLLRPQPTEGMKTIYFEVVVDGDVVNAAETVTDALNLRQAMEEAGILSPDEGPMIYTVSGILADGSDGAWWIITKDGEWTDSVDDQLIKDGERYVITRTVFS